MVLLGCKMYPRRDLINRTRAEGGSLMTIAKLIVQHILSIFNKTIFRLAEASTGIYGLHEPFYTRVL